MCANIPHRNLKMKFFQGQEVITPDGKGRVAYQILKAPEFMDAESVSVLLDSKRNYISYAGTKYPADKVTPC
jgi:hypothetical protein